MTHFFYLSMRRDKGEVILKFKYDSERKSHTVCVIVNTHWMHRNTKHCSTFTLHWLWKPALIRGLIHTHAFVISSFFFKWHQMLVSGLWATDEHRESNGRVYVPLKHDEAFPWRDLHILAHPVSQLHPFTLKMPRLLCTSVNSRDSTRAF